MHCVRSLLHSSRAFTRAPLPTARFVCTQRSHQSHHPPTVTPTPAAGVPDAADVVIVGGGVMGSSVAYFVSAQAPALKVCVVESDDSYSQCATARSAGSIRLQFSTPENIQMSLFGAQFLKSIDKHLRVSDDIGFKLHENGYLFLATSAFAKVLQDNVQIQKQHGANTLVLSPAQVAERFPFINVDGVHCGSLGLENEGWFDPYLLMTSFRRKAIAQGVQFLKAKAVGFTLDADRKRVQAVHIEHGPAGSAKATIGVRSFVVNSAGICGASMARLVDPSFDLPVRARKRFVYVLSLKEPLPSNCPLVIDPSGVYFRPEGKNYICGMSPPENLDPDCSDFVVDHSLFENTIWPTLAERVPAFEAAKNINAWAGHYDYNVFDQNAILGPHPNVPNFLLCNGFSGHGLQQSPAVGRALSELILYGQYRSIDLKRFSAERVLNNQPLLEVNVV